MSTLVNFFLFMFVFINYKLYVVIDNFVSLMQCALYATDIDAAILPSLLLRSRQQSSTLSRGDRLGD